MPITESAKKALRQTVRRRKRNVKQKNELKSLIKQFKKSVGDKESSQKLFIEVQKKLDKAVKVKLIKKNKSSRLKSRLSRLLK